MVSFPKVDVHSGELPLARENPRLDDLQGWGRGTAGDMELDYLRFLSNPEGPFNYLNFSWGNRTRGDCLVGFIKLRAEPHIKISFTVISKY